MAKKLNAKEKRLQQENERKAKIQKQYEERKKAEEIARIEKEEEEKRRAEEAARKKEEQKQKDYIEKRKKEQGEQDALSRRKKSRAKAAGLKSTFIIDKDKLLMTSFGKGNKAILEHDVDGEEILKICDEPTLTVAKAEKRFDIQGRKLRATADDPRYSYDGEVKTDLLGAKDKLEKKFFGSTFNDTVHIQLAYNILDIEKVFSLHINNIVYSINNMLGIEGEEDGDFLGYMSLLNLYDVFEDPDSSNLKDDVKNKLKKSRERFWDLLENPRIGYFGSAFYSTGNDIKAKNEKAVKRDPEDIYYMLALIGDIRQFLAHNKRNSLYNLKSTIKGDLYDATRKILDSLYNERVQSLNNDFIKHAKKDLSIIFRILEVNEKEKKKELAELYYNFVVRKTAKNMGFSLKKLREQIVKKSGEDTQSEDFSAVRQKFYKILDFLIYEKYYRDDEAVQRNVMELRASVLEYEKDDFYEQEAERIWKSWGQTAFDQIKKYVNGKAIRNIDTDKDLKIELIKDVKINYEETSDFSKIVYMFTLFIDGKEINDLLTTLINKFDNIASLLEVMQQKGLDCKFAAKYEMFKDSAAIVEELREINSFARMEKPHPSANMKMYCDAARLLGTDLSEDELAKYFQKLFANEEGKKDKNGKVLKKDVSLRNFIANNVLESSRFAYLVRYSKIEIVRKFAQNRAIVEFVLNEIPEKQIFRYCNACCKVDNEAITEDKAKNVSMLSDLITGMSFKQFKGVEQQANRRTKEYAQKQKLRSIVSLYLTVLYIITKNLVYVNARYFMAFHALERDSRLFKHDLDPTYTSFVKKYIADQRSSKPVLDKNTAHLEMNLQNVDGDASIREFRNCVMHVSAVRNADLYIDDVKEMDSYFALYHYLTQRHIEHLLSKNRKEVTLKVCEYFALMKKSGRYCKDLVKGLASPFGYNIPRYKNLSVEGLFDKNRPWIAPEEEGDIE